LTHYQNRHQGFLDPGASIALFSENLKRDEIKIDSRFRIDWPTLPTQSKNYSLKL
jgi:hypothetical protein